MIALFQCLTRPVRNSPNWHSHCAFYVMKRQPCFPAAWGYAGKQQVHTRNRWGNGEMITFVEYLLTSPACCDCSSSWLSSSALSSLHACSGPVWRRQNVRNSSLSAIFVSPELSDVRTCNEQCRKKAQASLLWRRKSLHRAAKMLVSSLFLNIHNFKLPRVKISLALTALGKKKKDSGSHMLLVYSNVHLLQVLWHVSNLFLISLTIETFSNLSSHTQCHYLIDKCAPADSKCYFSDLKIKLVIL